jgi:hypothetical protein
VRIAKPVASLEMGRRLRDAKRRTDDTRFITYTLVHGLASRVHALTVLLHAIGLHVLEPERYPATAAFRRQVRRALNESNPVETEEFAAMFESYAKEAERELKVARRAVRKLRRHGGEL